MPAVCQLNAALVAALGGREVIHPKVSSLCVGLVLLVLGIFMTSIAGSAMAQNTEAE